jgi:hypothetical protein
MRRVDARDEFVVLLDGSGREIGTARQNGVHGADASLQLGELTSADA